MKTKYLDKEFKEFSDLYTMGYSLKDIAKKYNVPWQSVQVVLKRFGVKLRSKYEGRILSYNVPRFSINDLIKFTNWLHLDKDFLEIYDVEARTKIVLEWVNSKDNTRRLKKRTGERKWNE